MVTLFRVCLEQATKCYIDTFSRLWGEGITSEKTLTLIPLPFGGVLDNFGGRLWGFLVVPGGH